MDEIKLKPCPFCGREAEVTDETCYGFIEDDFLVCCKECGLQFGFGNQYSTEQEAIEAWNRRAGECANNATATPAKRD